MTMKKWQRFLPTVNQMRVDTKRKNFALLKLIADPSATVFLDANILIPPDRSRIGVKPFDFEEYRQYWLEPLFEIFSGLAVHESVRAEFVDLRVNAFAKEKESEHKLTEHFTSSLTPEEFECFNSRVGMLAQFSEYSPERDNKKDRGEILSLSYMATKKYLYFAANDDLPRRLIEDAEKLNTGLDDMEFLHSFDVIYYLAHTGKYDKKGLRILYKYLYYLTPSEKRTNPSWDDFIHQMDELYQQDYLDAPEFVMQ